MPHLMFAAPAAVLLRDVFWKSLPVFAVAGLAGLFLRPASAAARHALWLLTLMGLLCLPVFCALLPQWAAPVLPAAPRPQVAAPRQAPDVLVTPPQAATVAPDVSPSPVSPALVASHAPAMTKAILPPMPAVSVPPTYSVIPSHPTVSDWVCLAWLVGALLVLGRTLLGLAAASRLVRRCRPVVTGPLVEAAGDVGLSLGLTRPLALRVGPVAVPMTCGVTRPVVLLPEGAEDWPAERLRAVLLHEAAHVKRLDWATMLLARCVCAAYWAHPLIWLAAARLRAEAEGACDDLVLTCGIPAPDYAAHLLEIVRGLAARRAALPATVAMANRPEVAGRLRTILDGHRPRRGVTRRGLALATVAAIALLAPLAALRPVASDPTNTSQVNRNSTDASLNSLLRHGQFDRLHLTSLMAGQSHWEVRLPDGTRVRLLSVGTEDAHGFVVSSWAPDGTPQYRSGVAASIPLVYGKRTYKFDWGVKFASAQRQNRASLYYSELTGMAYEGGGVESWQGGQPILDHYYDYFPEDQVHCGLGVSIATGPKQILIEAPVRTGAVRRLSTGEVISVSPPRHRALDAVHDNGLLIDTRSLFVTVPARFVHNMSDYELQTIGWDGKPYMPPHGFGGSYPEVSGGIARLLYCFRTSEVSPSKVKEFRFTYRPAYTAVFRNVALRPAVAATSMPSPPDMETERKNAAADRATSLANLRQIGLGIMRYAMDRHRDRFPDAAHWMDEIIPYCVPAQITGAARQQRIAALFHDPAAPAGQTWSYAYNRAFSGLSLARVGRPSITAIVFESIRGTRNAGDASNIGKSVPTPGWHMGGSDYLFADGHVKWLSPGATRPLFTPDPESAWDTNPIQGNIYDKATHKPIAGTYVIFSSSPYVITSGSVWPSSFTNKAGHFQSYLHPGDNYMMVQTNNRFKLWKNMKVDISSGKTGDTIILARSSIVVRYVIPTGRAVLLKSPLSRNVIKLLLPNAKGRVVVYDSAKRLTTVTLFTPTPHAAKSP